MISCPSCGKDIADDSVHCGYCGQEIVPGGGKKTIMGFGAITEDVIRQAAEEAKQARAEAEKGAAVGDAKATMPDIEPAAGGFNERVESKLKIPKPVLPPSSEPDTAPSAPGKLSIPKLGIGIDDTADSKTEAMEPVATNAPAPVTVEERVTEPLAASDEATAQEPSDETDWRVSHTDPPGSWTGPGESASDDWAMGAGDGDGEAGVGAEPTSPEAPVATMTANPLRLGDPLPDGTALTEGNQTLPAKGFDKRLLLIPVALLVFGGLCCVGTILFGWLGI